MAGYKNIEPRYKKGESGNPNGRPPVLPELKEVISKILAKEENGTTGLEKVVTAIYKRAVKGDIRACQELLDRYFGKNRQITDITIAEQPLFDLNAFELAKNGTDQQ